MKRLSLLFVLFLISVTIHAAEPTVVYTATTSLTTAADTVTSTTYKVLDVATLLDMETDKIGITQRPVLRLSILTDASNVDIVSFVFQDTSTTSTIGATAATTGLILEDGESALVEASKRYLVIGVPSGASNQTATVRVLKATPKLIQLQ